MNTAPIGYLGIGVMLVVLSDRGYLSSKHLADARIKVQQAKYLIYLQIDTSYNTNKVKCRYSKRDPVI